MTRPVYLCVGLAFALAAFWIEQCRAENDRIADQHQAVLVKSRMGGASAISENMQHQQQPMTVNSDDLDNYEYGTAGDDDDDDEEMIDLSEIAGLRTMAKRPSWAGKRSISYVPRRPMSIKGGGHRYGKFKKNMYRHRYNGKRAAIF